MDEFKARRLLRNWLHAAARSSSSKNDTAELEQMGLPPEAVAIVRKAAAVCREAVQEGANQDAERHATEIAGLLASRYGAVIDELATEHPRVMARRIVGE
jgi:hypothetical protein